MSGVYGQLRGFLPSRQRQPSQDRGDDPEGLVVLHTPDCERAVDILFVHGLGGTGRRTWCRDRDLDNFWPRLWLPHALPTARVLTFGYNAHVSSRKERASSTIGDFAADLLFRMKYGETTPERLGQVPIVIVAHSMGGLVFKRAFVEGHSNDQYKSIVTMVKGVIFLATPHRGTDLAETLHKLLAGSVFGHSSREYVKELARKSPTIDEMDKAFRHHAPKLEIFSFYETLSTAVGPASFMIVETAAAVTGLPTETKIPLNADHHNACKFTSPEDPNYVSILGALRSIVTSASPASAKRGEDTKKDTQHLADLLGIAGPPDEDLASYRALRRQGTCERFMESPEFGEWLQPTQSSVLWVHAEPGDGKSVTCSSVVDHLNKAGHSCSYYFFKYGQHQKKSASHMLRSLAYQTALQLNEFRQALVDLAKAGVCVSEADAKTVWKSIFKSVLATVKTKKRIFWVIDGLDEADSSNQVVEQLSAAATFDSHMLCILVFSRPLGSIHRAFRTARKKIAVVETPLPDNRDDIRLSVTDQVDHLICGDKLKLELVDEIVSRSHGSFLWASLVGKAVIGKTREDQVQQVLKSTPDDMDQLYDRMMATVTAPNMEEDKQLAKALMSCAMFAKTPITVDEFLELYPAETKDIMDFGHTVSQVCGQFVVVAHGCAELVHHSAREYLMRKKDAPFSSDPRGANEDLLVKCLATLCDKMLRRKLSMLNPPKPLHYSSAFWPDHLQEASVGSARILKALVMFFNGPYPLAWIRYLAMSSRLSELPGASRKLSGYLQKCAKLDGSGSLLSRRLEDVSLLESWAVDLMKLPAKFGPYLLEDPTLVYKCVPALCPASSIIHRKFSAGPGASLFVSGLSENSWGDCLARISVGAGCLATSSLYLALASDAAIGIYGTALFEERTVLDLGGSETTLAVAFNNSGTLLAAHRFSRTFVWKTADWSLLLSIKNPPKAREVYKLSTQQGDAAVWSELGPRLLEEQGVPEEFLLWTAWSAAFNSDCSQIAVACRAFPLSVWSVEPVEMIARLRREGRPGRGEGESYTRRNCHVWHPHGEILGAHNGRFFKWDHVTDIYEEKESGDCAHEVTCSPNGQIFVIYEFSISIFDFATMSVLYRLVAEVPTYRAVFSPNGARLYHLDVDGTCEIWEPDCLQGLADAAPVGIARSGFEEDGMDSPRPPTPLSSSGSRTGGRKRVILLAAGRSSSDPVAYATNEAAVFVYDPATKKTHETDRWPWPSHARTLSWNLEQNRLAYMSNSKRIAIKSITFGSTAETPLSVETVLDVPSMDDEPMSQILFHPVGDRLFVSQYKSLCRILSVPDGTVMAEATFAYSYLGRWQQHPREWAHLVCFTPEAARIISWDNLEQKGCIPLDIPRRIVCEKRDLFPPMVDFILESYEPRYIFLHTFAWGSVSPPRFFVLPADSIYKPFIASDSTPAQEEVAVRPLELPQSLVSNIKHGFGILSGGVLVFLDKRHWVCTVSLSSPTKETRVFFLPGDWATDKT